MLEISIKKNIKLFNSCISACTNNSNKRKSLSQENGGVVTKDGLVYFPSEFVKKVK
jgi:hypothetical protein